MKVEEALYEGAIVGASTLFFNWGIKEIGIKIDPYFRNFISVVSSVTLKQYLMEKEWIKPIDKW